MEEVCSRSSQSFDGLAFRRWQAAFVDQVGLVQIRNGGATPIDRPHAMGQAALGEEDVVRDVQRREIVADQSIMAPMAAERKGSIHSASGLPRNFGPNSAASSCPTGFK